MTEKPINPVKQEKILVKRGQMILDFVATKPAVLSDEELMLKFSISINSIREIFARHNILIEDGCYVIGQKKAG